MADKEDARRALARAHYSYEPGITQIFTIRSRPECEASPDEPIKLLEVNENTIASGIHPLGFDPVPSAGIPFSSVIVEITPDEFGRIESKELTLPDGWTLGELLPKGL
jgi:hypothetical protein